MRAGRGVSGWTALALAAVFAASAAAEDPASPEPTTDASAAIAANDALAATAGVGSSGNPTEARSSPAAAGESVSQPPTAPSSGFSRIASWIGVDSEDSRWLRLGTWEGNLGFLYSGSTLDVSLGSHSTQVAPSDHSTTRIAVEELSIRNDEFSIFDRRLVTGSLGITLGLGQVKQQFSGSEQTQHGTLDGYAFDATFLGDKPLYGRAWADQVQNYSTLSFGETTKDTESSVGASLNLRQDSWLHDAQILPYFDAQLQVYQQHTLQQFTSEGTTTAEDQIQRVASLNAHNGTETSDLYLIFQYTDFNYVSYPTGSYHSNGAVINYNGDFGTNLDTNWNSTIGYNDRAGDVPLQSFTVNESVDVRHNTALESSYAYNLYQQNGTGGDQQNQSAAANVTYTLWQNLNLSGGASGSYSRFPNGTADAINALAGLNYSRNLPIGGQGFLNVQGIFTRNSDNLSTGEVAIVDEAHSAPPVLGVGNGFALNNPFVLSSSIVVVDTRGGARIPTTAQVDYTVTTDGNQTRILVLPTSVIIQPNDPLAVSYSYQLPAQANYNSSNVSATVGVNLGWFALSYNHTQVNAPEVISNAVTLVGNTTSDDVTASLRGDWDWLKLGLGANVLRFDSTSLAYVNQTYSAGVGYQPFYAVGVNLDAAWSEANYSVPARKSGYFNGRLDVNLYAPPSIRYDALSATLFALRNRLTDSELPTQTLTQFGATVNYTLGKLSLAAGAQYGDFVIGNSTTKNFQFNLSANRRF